MKTYSAKNLNKTRKKRRDWLWITEYTADTQI